MAGNSILVINAAGAETRVALVENGTIHEYYLERKREKGIVGNIYKGRVVRVLPGMQAAFVDIGLEKAAFLYVGDVYGDPDFSEEFELTEGEHPERGARGARPSRRPRSRRSEARARRGPRAPRPPRRRGGRGRRGGAAAAAEPPARAEPAAEARRRSPRPTSASSRLPAPLTAIPLTHEIGMAPVPAVPGAAGRRRRRRRGPPRRRPPAAGRGRLPPRRACARGARARAACPARPPLPRRRSRPCRARRRPASPGRRRPPRTAARRAPARPRARRGAIAATASGGDRDERDAGPRPPRGPRAGRPRRREGRRAERAARAAGIANGAPQRAARRSARRSRRTSRTCSRKGQEVIVQVAKDPIGTKGARITSHISLPGRHLVFMPTVDHIGISRRIEKDGERRRLREIVDRMRPEGTGFIVRTVAESVEAPKLEADIRFLIQVWNEIIRTKDKVAAPALLHGDLDLILRATRDLFTARRRASSSSTTATSTSASCASCAIRRRTSRRRSSSTRATSRSSTPTASSRS